MKMGVFHVKHSLFCDVWMDGLGGLGTVRSARAVGAPSALNF
jgi:hypothetical protein